MGLFAWSGMVLTIIKKLKDVGGSIHVGTQKWWSIMENPIDGNSHSVDDSYSGWWFSHPSEQYEFVSWDDNRNPINMEKSS